MTVEVTRTGEYVHVGRRGIRMAVVDVGGERFVRGGIHGETEPVYFTECWKCDGTGTIPGFMHVHAGECFTCNGGGTTSRKIGDKAIIAFAKRRIGARKRADRKAAEEAARRAEVIEAQVAERAAWVEAHQDFIARLGKVGDDYADWRVANVASRVIREGQIEPDDVVADTIARMDAVEAKIAGARYAGAEGEKVTVTGTVAVSMNLDGDYGTRRMLVVNGTGDDAGITVKTIGTGETLWAPDRGDVVTITGTVKSHAEYQGVAQTVVTRAKVVVREPATV